MIPLEALPGFASWGRNLEVLLARPEPIWVYGIAGAGVSHAIRELALRRGTPFMDDADQASPAMLETWLKAHPGGVLGAHRGPEDPAPPPAIHRCLPLRLWTVDEAPDALPSCLEALARELEVALPLPPALGRLPCPGNLLELHNRVLRWKLLGQAPEGDPPLQLPMETDCMATNLHALERMLLHRALRRSYGNRAESARRLGVSRRQLYLLIDRHGDPVRGSLPVAPPLKRLKKRE
ncbi:helix-turn-helix domain-containing protein [Holophaga foetida]|uniref:helix-turn-helix domain-containing protein n=1 Tax=Holophaga foetida TaxID=35839 RepID=UPI0002473F07|nr:helix-turn-helix domain-containing protein [Holophaga foetida]